MQGACVQTPDTQCCSEGERQTAATARSMHFEYLTDLLVTFGVGGLVVFALRPLKVPPLVGLLVAGAVVGPHGLRLVADPERVELLAEIGVVLLLFTVGLKFSLSQLMGMWRAIVGAGSAQMGIAIAHQVLETFGALRRLGQRVELRFYAGEGHWPGTWSEGNLRDLHEHALEWFDTHLDVTPDEPNPKRL